MNRKLPFGVVGIGLAVALAIAAGPGLGRPSNANADSIGTLQVSGTYVVDYHPENCPVGTPVTTVCHPAVSSGAALFPGLGSVTTKYTQVIDDFSTACMRLHGQIPIAVAGKGEIDLAMSPSACVTPDQLSRTVPPIAVVVSGGSGLYAGASGNGALSISNNITGPEMGTARVAWTGALTVAGLTFDTTPPQIAGATSKTVKTRAASGARVVYSVNATDATDGGVPTACAPKSGFRFSVGRTTVNCTADDSSGNTAAAKFVITVKRVRR